MHKEIADMNKGELQIHAKETFGVELDLRKNLDTLIKEVAKLTMTRGQVTPTDMDEQPKPEFLKNRETGFWFPYTDMLAKRGDLIPCDFKGEPV